MTPQLLIFLLILFPAIYFSVKKNRLTLSGAITGGLIACFIYFGAGLTGIALIGFFFLSGTLVTSWKINEKELLGAAEMNKGKRTTSQVIANGGVAAIAGLVAWILPGYRELFQLAMAASLASATADTLSSELGTLYGKRFYNILNFRPGIRGDNGVVSFEGTLFGLLGSFLIAIIYVTGFGRINHFVIIVIAGTFGNMVDSLLGATLEKKHFIENDAVNFLNTLFAAFVVFIVEYLF